MAHTHCMPDTLITNTNSEHVTVIAFPLQNGHTKVPQIYVIHALPILFITFTTAFMQAMRMTISPVSIKVLEYMNLFSLDQFIAELTGCFMITVNCQFI